ncbi:MAG: hypothetical protein CMJ76_12670 [Planctomycetaceae bacterium]|nr:hypothetical protein [Planctomycetaceae bacterium]|tara:strand:- start:5195 stop:6325 length:1131 start_codon:yes stop_codon:yes gene_type:complete
MRQLNFLLLLIGIPIFNVQAVEPSLITETGKTIASTVEDVSQVHSGQLLADDADALWNVTQSWLDQTKTESGGIVKLNLYASSADQLRKLESTVASRFAKGQCPPICSLVTLLPQEKRVALDLVAIGGHESQDVRTLKRGKEGARVLPAGKRIYISGQAARNDDLQLATKETITGLLESVRYLNRSNEDIICLKAFVNEMAGVDRVYQAAVEVFGQGKEPPLVCVEWQSSVSVPIEIEMIVWGGEADPNLPVLEYKTVLDLPASPVFSRVCQINSGPTIYIAGLYSSADNAELEVKQSYGLLRKTLAATNSDMKHLVKATYYVTDGATSSALGSLRTKLYSPTRPPAASKATVAVIGSHHQRFLMDMIAVPMAKEN